MARASSSTLAHGSFEIGSRLSNTLKGKRISTILLALSSPTMPMSSEQNDPYHLYRTKFMDMQVSSLAFLFLLTVSP